MKFTVVTILPELIEPALTAGVVGRARTAGLITVTTVNPRDFTHDRHRTVDDTPYGGGPGMVMKPEPLLAAIEKASEPAATGQAAPAGQGGVPDSFSKRVLRKVESTLSKLVSAGRAEEQEPKPTSDKIDTAVTDAEAAIAEIEAQMRGETHVGTSGSSTVGPNTAGASSAVAASKSTSSKSSNQPTGSKKSTSEDEAAEATLAALEEELGMRLSGEDRQREAGGRSINEAKILGPADADPVPVPVPVAAPVPVPVPATVPVSVPVPVPIPAMAAAAATDAAAAAAAATVAATTTSTSSRPHRILLSPSGTPLTQSRVRALAKLDHLVLVCGRYEGIDQRVIDTAIDEELSIGDYVLSGGELGALVIIDAVSRFVPGVLGEATSVDDESFSAGLLEYPQYTRPPDLAGNAVPAILMSGNHAAIAAWRRQQAMQRTAARRPDLWRAFRPSRADDKLLAPLRARTHLALVHHPVVDRTGTVITTSLTNFDIHDLARSSLTFGLGGYHIVTPITSQREKAEHIAKLWSEDAQGEHRAAALRLVRVADSIESVIAALTAEYGRAPNVVATSANRSSFPGIPRRTTSDLLAEAALDPAPLLLLLGTGWGLAEALIPSVSRVLAPIEGASEWNHLSVRSAGAVILDRLFGRPA